MMQKNSFGNIGMNLRSRHYHERGAVKPSRQKASGASLSQGESQCGRRAWFEKTGYACAACGLYHREDA